MESWKLLLPDGKKYKASLVGSDPDTDLAVLKIEVPRESLTVIPMGDSADLKVGQKKPWPSGIPSGWARPLLRGWSVLWAGR